MYGNKWYHNPQKDPPILAVIDSGTTLCLLPKKSYEGIMTGIAEKVRHDPTISFVCTREEKSRKLGSCYFNNTRCQDITDKLEPMKFILGGVVFEIKIQAFLKDVFDDKKEKFATKPPEKP